MDNKLIIYKPPLLAVLEQGLKIRDYNEETRLGLAVTLVENLLSDLGVSKNADTSHHLRAIKYITESCVNYTPKEIEKAFQLAISGEINIDMFQQLNAVVIGKVMMAYETYKGEKLTKHRKKMADDKIKADEYSLTPEEIEEIMIEGCDRIFKDYEQNGMISEQCAHLYDYIFKKDLLPRDKEYKDEKMKKAKLIAKSEAMTRAGGDYELHRKLKDTLIDLQNGIGGNIVSIAKRLVLEDYFTKLIKEDKSILNMI